MPWLWTAAMDAFGPGEREGAEERGPSEAVSGIGTARGSRPRVQGLVGKQEVAAHASGTRPRPPGAVEKMTGGARWARPAS